MTLKKVRKTYFKAKTLNLHNTRIPFRESSLVRNYFVNVMQQYRFELCITQKLIFGF